MRPPISLRLPQRLSCTVAAAITASATTAPSSMSSKQARALHTSIRRTARVVGYYSVGPPPDPPKPTTAEAATSPTEEQIKAAEETKIRIERRKKHAEVLEKAQDLRAAAADHKKARGNGNSNSHPTGDKSGRDRVSAYRKEGAPGSSDTGGRRKRFWKYADCKVIDGKWIFFSSLLLFTLLQPTWPIALGFLALCCRPHSLQETSKASPS